MNKVKFSKAEQPILDVLSKQEFFVSDPGTKRGGLSSLLFKMMIERDESYINRFKLTALGKKAIEWNEGVDIMNGKHSTHIANS